jgi:hypothetical protein
MIDPSLVSLITISDLGSALGQGLNWYIVIENPVTKTPYKLTAQQFYTLINGGLLPPDGILSGLNITINNATTPKTASITAGQWRIAGVIYQINVVTNFNINTADATNNRIDSFYAKNDGTLGYIAGTASFNPIQPNIPVNSLRIANIVVPTGGGAINNPTTGNVIYAVMNSINIGDFDITGNYKVNGLPLLPVVNTFTFTQADLVSMGSGFYKIPLTLTGNQSVLSVKIVYSGNTIQVVPQWQDGFLINFDNNSTQTIYVKIG